MGCKVSNATPDAVLPLAVAEPSAQSIPVTLWQPAQTRPGSVLLFRRTFTTPVALPVTLDIFADTRYEVWLDGTWLGRGPARFSTTRQEYDSYTPDALDAGVHTLAVLVQYAPNARRSVDLGGALFARVSAAAAGDVLVGTDTDWRVWAAPAWDTRTGYISSLRLIGPKEVLDLRALPADWMQPAYDDSAWISVQVLEPSPLTALTPRSIPLLTDRVRLPAAVVETGTLSPNCRFTALRPRYEFTATAATSLRVEALSIPALTLDDIPLIWHALDDARRPDVWTVTATLATGVHTLRAEGAGEEALLALCADNVAWGALPAPALYRPEQRMLLANPVPGGDAAPTVQLAPDGAEIAIPAGAAPRYVVLDFGRTLHARMVVIATGEAGTVLDAGWDERLTENRPLPNPGTLTASEWAQVDSWVLDGTSRTLTTLDARAGRYLLIQVFGPSAVRLSGLRALEETYPAEVRGSFTSADPLLNRIWQVGVETLIPNMTDAYTDTPWRERGQWWGDAFIAFHINRAVYGDVALFRRGLRQMAEGLEADGRPHAAPPHDGGMLLDYGLLWIEGLYEYWRYTGDLSLVAELYPAAQRLASFCRTYENTAGLLDMPQVHWSQSALIDWSGATSRSGESVALNALYARALGALGEMASALGNTAPADGYAQKSAAIRERLTAEFFAPEAGAYHAGRYAGELRPPTPHAQAYALRYGVAPVAQQARVAQAMVTQMTPFFNEKGWARVEMYGMFWVLDALGQARQTEPALALIREQYGRLLAQGATTWPELFTANQTRANSLSHSWGGSPTWYLSTYVLGGQVLSATTWQVAPQPGDVNWARGVVPLPAGMLTISWTQELPATLALDVTAPVGTQGSILLPVTGETRVWLNEQLVWDAGPCVNAPTVTMGETGLWITWLAGGVYEVRVCSQDGGMFSR